MSTIMTMSTTFYPTCTTDGKVTVAVRPIAMHGDDGGDSIIVQVTDDDGCIVQELVIEADKIEVIVKEVL